MHAESEKWEALSIYSNIGIVRVGDGKDTLINGRSDAELWIWKKVKVKVMLYRYTVIALVFSELLRSFNKPSLNVLLSEVIIIYRGFIFVAKTRTQTSLYTEVYEWLLMIW